MCVYKQLRDLMIYTPIQWQFIHNFSWEVKSMMYFKPFLTQYACRTNFIKFLCSAPSVSNIFRLEDWNTWSSETHSRNADQCRQPLMFGWLFQLEVSLGFLKWKYPQIIQVMTILWRSPILGTGSIP